MGGDAKRVRDRRARAARRFRPNPVELLLIAEAPPAAPDRYFYFPEVGSHDSLFRYVSRSILGIEPSRAEKADRLAELRDRGVFLIDLMPDPVDGSDLADYVPVLLRRVRRLDPGKIILIKATVHDAALGPLVAAGLPVSRERIPFPGSGQQRRFEETFARALED